MNNDILIFELKNLVSSERKITSKILVYLKEVEKRNLHLEMGYGNMFDFCTKELGYSISAASRRISAMRLMKSLPEVETKIQNGAVNLTTLSRLQNFIRAEERKKSERLSTEEKRELLYNIEDKSQKEVELELIKRSPESTIPRYQQRIISGELSEIRLVVPNKFVEKLGRMRRLNSHRSIEWVDVIERALDLAIEKLDPEGKSAKLREKTKEELEEDAESERWEHEFKCEAIDNTQENLRAYKAFLKGKPSNKTRYIRKEDIRRVHDRAAGQCEFVNPKTGKRCDATLFLEIDHKVAWAKGGKNSFENLQLICGGHNKLKAKKEFGKRDYH